jgi:parvulin-like peptidyl-prolyl isomerase
VVVILALLLIGYGYYTDRVLPRRDVVFQIGNQKYTYAHLEERVKSDVAQGRFNVRDTANSVTATIARMQREELTRILGEERGITVSEDELTAGIRNDLNITEELSRNELAPILRDELRSIDLSLDEYRSIVESQVIEEKIKADLTSSLPEETEQVNLLFIDAGSQANAILSLQALEDGTEFAEVAQQYSQHAASNDDGVLGWVPREALDPELADVAFSLDGRSGIIETEESFYIIDVQGKETRPIDPGVVEDIGTQRFNELLEAAFDETPFIYNLTQGQLIDLANEIGGTFG